MPGWCDHPCVCLAAVILLFYVKQSSQVVVVLNILLITVKITMEIRNGGKIHGREGNFKMLFAEEDRIM